MMHSFRPKASADNYVNKIWFYSLICNIMPLLAYITMELLEHDFFSNSKVNY